MYELEVAVAAGLKIAYNFWPVIVAMVGYAVWESVNDFR